MAYERLSDEEIMKQLKDEFNFHWLLSGQLVIIDVDYEGGSYDRSDIVKLIALLSQVVNRNILK